MDDTTTDVSQDTSDQAPAAITIAPISQADPDVPEITLEEFGMKLSGSDKRVELVNAFIFVERNARQFKDTEANFQTRFVAFEQQPA
ncbi:hypothetical protein [Burkholderia anthina]|uniref:hypothetical protein n=1 Tax=Burkholderia anthina TaxID=179879 RepID=UPI00158C1CE0|nr:hypothetical protein [Burkholderia anthina]